VDVVFLEIIFYTSKTKRFAIGESNRESTTLVCFYLQRTYHILLSFTTVLVPNKNITISKGVIGYKKGKEL
jgi:hypothetical protein